MTIEEIESGVIDILTELLQDVSGNTGKPPITRDTTLESLGLDSLDNVEIVIDIEDRFDITIQDEAARACKTVGEIIAYIAGWKALEVLK